MINSTVCHLKTFVKNCDTKFLQPCSNVLNETMKEIQGCFKIFCERDFDFSENLCMIIKGVKNPYHCIFRISVSDIICE